MIRRKCTLTILFFGLSLMCSQLPAFQALEIPRPMLRGVAKTVVRGGTPIIYYNPIALKRMGPEVGQFVRAHEYAHLRLGHFRRNMSYSAREAEADLYAAMTAPPRSVQAARNWFLQGRGGGLAHGSPRMRASRLSRGLSFQSPYRIVRRIR